MTPLTDRNSVAILHVLLMALNICAHKWTLSLHRNIKTGFCTYLMTALLTIHSPFYPNITANLAPENSKFTAA